MKILRAIVGFFAAITKKNQVVAFFLDPSAGASAAYKEADFVGENGSLTDVTKGKQIIISVGGGKAQILAYDTDSLTPAATRNPGWIAPSQAWLATPTLFTADIDFANSDLVYGNNNRVQPGAFDTAKVIPFKKVGKAIKYDGTVGGSTTPTVVAGIQTTTAPAPATNTGGGNTTNPTTANSAKTGLAAVAWYVWGLIAVGFVLLYFLFKYIVKMMKGNKGNKKVDK